MADIRRTPAYESAFATPTTTRRDSPVLRQSTLRRTRASAIKCNASSLSTPTTAVRTLSRTLLLVCLLALPALSQSHSTNHRRRHQLPQVLGMRQVYPPVRTVRALGPGANDFASVRNISENAPVGYLINQFSRLGTANSTFRINRESDEGRQFSVSQDGFLRVARPLDREVNASYLLKLELEDSAKNIAHNYIQVNLVDVNDEAPDFRPSVVVCYENIPNVQKIFVDVFDRDTDEFGPPFTLEPIEVNSGIISTWTFDSRSNRMELVCNANLDREGSQGKEQQLSFRLADKQQQMAVRNITVIIGDKNDNPSTNGEKRVLVYAYENGYLPNPVNIGRVYVTDPDDWDLGDKEFVKIEDSYDMFSVERNGGMVQMTREPSSTGGREYTVKVKVTDRSRPNDPPAIGTVLVTIERLEQAAFDNAGSLRIKGITASQFIEREGGRPSRSDRLKSLLAKLLNIADESNVDVFSVMSERKMLNNLVEEAVVDVWFSAHNSPYKQAAYLNGIVQSNRDAFESELNADIVQVNINECYFPKCDECWTRKTIAQTPTLVNANRTALVGATTATNPVCESCRRPDVPTKCTKETCYNGGICHNTGMQGFFCECRGEFHGSRCEGTTRNFNGQGFAWLAAPEKTCTSTNVTFEFATQQANAMLVYFGPMYAPKANDGDVYANDHLIIKLVDGRPNLQLNVGKTGCLTDGVTSCTSETTVQLERTLADGKWHTIEVHFNSRQYEIIVDRCEGLTNGASEQSCRRHGTMASDEERFNIVDPIQLGGISPTANIFKYPGNANMVPNFDGCMRNLYWNNELVDLETVALSVSSVPRCVQTDTFCETNDLAGPGYCINGECISSFDGNDRKCICTPGYGGERCDQRISWVNFTPGSYMQYGLSAPPSQTLTTIDVLFVTQRTISGTLARGSRNRGTYIGTQLTNGHARGVYDYGIDGEHSLSIDDVKLATIPYYLSLRRSPTGAQLTLDGHMGRYMSEIRDELDGHSTVIDVDSESIFLGADGSNVNDDFVGCIGDYRWNGQQMPLTQTTTTKDVTIKNREGVTDKCTLVATCATANLDCPAGLVCQDFWKGAFCTCQPYQEAQLGPDGQAISCGPLKGAVRSLGITNWAVTAIILCLFLLLLVVLIMVVYTRNRQTFHELRPDDDRDNQMDYAVEGGGEGDQHTYNIGPLRKPVLQPDVNGINASLRSNPPVDTAAHIARGVEEAALGDRAPYDELRVYDDEGDNHSIATLSSISSAATTIPDLDAHLNDWGPRFQNMANIYRGGDDEPKNV